MTAFPRRLAPLVALLPLGIAAASTGMPVAATGAAFAAPVKLAGGCGGEPSIDTDFHGHVYVSAPKGLLDGVASCEGALTSTNGVATWVSNDGGVSFGPKISVGTLNGGADSDTTVDQQNGDVYVADLEAIAADICVSHDHGQTYVTAQTGAETCSTPVNITGQTGIDNDREWVTTYGPTASYPHKDVYLSYHDLAIGEPLVWKQQDGGPFVPLPPPAILTSDPAFNQAVTNGTVVAKPVIAKDGTIYIVVTTQSSPTSSLDQLWLMKSTDHGSTWTDALIFDGSQAGAVTGLVFNDLAMDGAGNLYLLTLGDTQGAVPPAHAYLFRSTDQGATWSPPVTVSKDGGAVALAAMHGGPLGGQLVIGYYHSTNAADPNTITLPNSTTPNAWQYVALESTNATAPAPTFTTSVLGVTSRTTGGTNPSGYVHQGQICTQGINCSVGQVIGGGQGNRNLADFSSVTVDQNGCAIFTYADDGAIAADQSNFDFSLVNNDVTRQTAGCFATVAATAPSQGTGGSGGNGGNGAAGAGLVNTAAAGPGSVGAGLAVVAVAGSALVARRRRGHRPD